MEKEKHGLWRRLNQRLARHRVWVIVGACVLAVLLVIVSVFIVLSHNATAPKSTTHVATKPRPAPVVTYYSPLSGLPVASLADESLPVTAVMIENSPSARPQSGLKTAGVVFEAIAEGGITRFAVLYQGSMPSLIGPVRSIRLYDVQWLAAFNASIAHVGGSQQGLATVRNGQYRDIDQFFNGAYYYRSTDRAAPHNVYTTGTKLAALETKKGYTSSQFTGFERTDAKPTSPATVTKISVHISGALYDSTYAYDAATNTYPRNQAGAPHLDREAGQIAPSSVVVMHVDEKTVMQDGKREDITTIGNGVANIFQNGTEQTVTWHKDSLLGQIYFTDSKGARVGLVRGQAWLVALPNAYGKVTWQ